MHVLSDTELASKAERLRARHHAECYVCGENGHGLGLAFRLEPDGSVVADFGCHHRFQGFKGRLHGGVIAMILDDAMTNCLLKHGVVAVTGRLNASFRDPVQLDCPAQVRSHIESNSGAFYLLRAEFVQQGEVRAYAEGKFKRVPNP